MSARQYRIKPADVDAIQWDHNAIDAVLAQFAEWDVSFSLDLKRNHNGIESSELSIATVTGWAYPSNGDWIVRDPDTQQIRKVTAAEFTDKYEPKEDPS